MKIKGKGCRLHLFMEIGENLPVPKRINTNALERKKCLRTHGNKESICEKGDTTLQEKKNMQHSSTHHNSCLTALKLKLWSRAEITPAVYRYCGEVFSEALRNESSARGNEYFWKAHPKKRRKTITAGGKYFKQQFTLNFLIVSVTSGKRNII